MFSGIPWCCFLLGSFLATRTQAMLVAPAPIRWGGLAHRMLVIAPAILDDSSVLPQTLSVRDGLDGKSSVLIPYFSVTPDKTITWDARGWCMEAENRTIGSAIRVNRCTGAPSQKWNVLPLGLGRQSQIQLAESNRCLGVVNTHGFFRRSRALIELQECEQTVAESWRFEEPMLLPRRGSSRHPGFSSALHRATMAFVVLVVLGALRLSPWFRRWLATALVGAPSRGSEPLKVDDGGLCLSAPLTAHHTCDQSFVSEPGTRPAIMAIDPLVAEFDASVVDDSRRTKRHESMIDPIPVGVDSPVIESGGEPKQYGFHGGPVPIEINDPDKGNQRRMQHDVFSTQPLNAEFDHPETADAGRPRQDEVFAHPTPAELYYPEMGQNGIVKEEELRENHVPAEFNYPERAKTWGMKQYEYIANPVPVDRDYAESMCGSVDEHDEAFTRPLPTKLDYPQIGLASNKCARDVLVNLSKNDFHARITVSGAGRKLDPVMSVATQERRAEQQLIVEKTPWTFLGQIAKNAETSSTPRRLEVTVDLDSRKYPYTGAFRSKKKGRRVHGVHRKDKEEHTCKGVRKIWTKNSRSSTLRRLEVDADLDSRKYRYTGAFRAKKKGRPVHGVYRKDKEERPCKKFRRIRRRRERRDAKKDARKIYQEMHGIARDAEEDAARTASARAQDMAPRVGDGSVARSKVRRTAKNQARKSTQWLTDIIDQYRVLKPDESEALAELIQKISQWSAKRAEMNERLSRKVDDVEFAAELGLSGGAAEYKWEVERMVAAKDLFIKCNLRLVWWVSKKYSTSGVPCDDLIQEGIRGLMKALEKWDHSKGFQFSTYAVPWIRQHMVNAIATQTSGLRLPSSMKASVNKLNRARGVLEQRGQPASDAALANYMGVSKERVQNIKAAAKTSRVESDMIADPAPNTSENLCTTHMITETVNEILDIVLSPREAHVLRMRFGLDSDSEATVANIARAMELPRKRVEQIQDIALKKLTAYNKSADELTICLDQDFKGTQSERVSSTR